MNIQDWSPLAWTGWLSLLSKGLLRVFSNTTVQKSINSAFFMVQLSHPYMTTGKTIASTTWTFVSKTMSLLFNMLSRLVITFLPRSNYLNFMAAVIIHSDFGAQENKPSHCFPICLPWSYGTGCHGLSFWMLSFKPAFHSPLSPSTGSSLVLLCFLL